MNIPLAVFALVLSSSVLADSPNVIRTPAPILQATEVNQPEAPETNYSYQSLVSATSFYVSQEYTRYVGNCPTTNPLVTPYKDGGNVFLCVSKHNFSGSPARWRVRHMTVNSNWLQSIKGIELYDSNGALLFSSSNLGLVPQYSKSSSYTEITFYSNTLFATWNSNPGLVHQVVFKD